MVDFNPSRRLFAIFSALIEIELSNACLSPAEICDFGGDSDLSLCDWTTRNLTGQTYLPRWEPGAGTLSNWIGGPPKDAGGGEPTDKGEAWPTPRPRGLRSRLQTPR